MFAQKSIKVIKYSKLSEKVVNPKIIDGIKHWKWAQTQETGV